MNARVDSTSTSNPNITISPDQMYISSSDHYIAGHGHADVGEANSNVHQAMLISLQAHRDGMEPMQAVEYGAGIFNIAAKSQQMAYQDLPNSHVAGAQVVGDMSQSIGGRTTA